MFNLTQLAAHAFRTGVQAVLSTDTPARPHLTLGTRLTAEEARTVLQTAEKIALISSAATEALVRDIVKYKPTPFLGGLQDPFKNGLHLPHASQPSALEDISIAREKQFQDNVVLMPIVTGFPSGGIALGALVYELGKAARSSVPSGGRVAPRWEA